MGISPPLAAASLTALHIMLEEPERVGRLRERGREFLHMAQEAGLDTGLSAGLAITPILVGGSIRATRLSQALFDRGINVQPIIYPAVEEKMARLRFFISAMHAEPLASIAILMFIFSVMRVRTLGGIDTAAWIMVGMLGFFTFRRTGMLAMRAVTMNFPLFTYRQVKPVDAVLIRGSVEGVIMTFVALAMLFGGGLFGLAVLPGDPLLALGQFLALWLLGMGFVIWSSNFGQVHGLGRYAALASTETGGR